MRLPCAASILLVFPGCSFVANASPMPSLRPPLTPSSQPASMPSAQAISMRSLQETTMCVPAVCSCSTPPSSMPSGMPSSEPSYRFTVLGFVLGSYYPDRQFTFGPATHQYAALEFLATSDPVLVPVPDDSNSVYMLLQRYVLVLLYLYSNGDMWSDKKWLKDETGSVTCNWSGVTCPDGSSIESLSRTYSTVKTEPII
jgi:hypothetical protein